MPRRLFAFRRRYTPYSFHRFSTRALISGGITCSAGHPRAKPSSGHYFVASIPIREP
jgi:hypothetical protein